MINFIKKIFGNKPYVSEIDRFIAELDKRYPKKSASQIAEIAKYKRISYLRDNVVANNENNKIWQEF